MLFRSWLLMPVNTVRYCSLHNCCVLTLCTAYLMAIAGLGGAEGLTLSLSRHSKMLVMEVAPCQMGKYPRARVRLHRRAWRCLVLPAALAAHPNQHPYSYLFLSSSLPPSLSPFLSSLSLFLAINSLSFQAYHKKIPRAQPIHMRFIPLFALHNKPPSDLSGPERYQTPASPVLRAGHA